MVGCIPTLYRFYNDKVDVSSIRHNFELLSYLFILIILSCILCVNIFLTVNALSIDYLYLNVFIAGVLHFTVNFVLILVFMVITINQVTAMLFLPSNDRR